MSRNHPRRRPQRGAAAIEAALSLVILLFVAVGTIYFAQAMSVRQRLTSATSRAARVCATAVNAANMGNCVDQQVRAEMGPVIASCARLNIDPQEVVLRPNLSVWTTRVECEYAGDFAEFLQAYEAEVQMTLTAQATMPVAH